MCSTNRSAAANAAGEGGLARIARVCVVLLLTVPVGIAAAPSVDDLYAAADQAAAELRLADMQHIYESILAEHPRDVRALTGRAAALAWQQRFDGAQQAYGQALAIEPRNSEAAVGLGYAYAWDGEYARAHTSFNRALAIDPTHVGARKGIAYSYWWSGHRELALESFDLAASIAPLDAEIWEARGQTLQQSGHNRDAIDDFDRALALDPQRHSTLASRMEAYRSAPVFELSARAGTTSGAGSGLRQVEIAHWSSTATRLAFRLDNSLGLDNASITDRGDNAPGYFLSAGHRFDSGITVIAEGGRRELIGGDQNLATLQAVIETRKGALRLGAQLGDHELSYTDTLFFGGINLPVGQQWRLEPMIYISESGAAADDEWRVVLNAERPVNLYLTAGVFAGSGRIDSQQARFSGNTQLYGGWVRYESGGRSAITASLRRESTPSQDFTVAEVGFSYRLPGNRGR